MNAQLTVDVARDPAAGKTAAAWFALAFERLGGELRDWLLAVAPLDQAALRNPDGYGSPGSIWAHVWAKDGQGRGKTTAFAEDRWAAFLQAMAEQPCEAEFTLCRLYSGGFTHSWPFLKVSARPSDDFPDWWFLEANFPEEWIAAPGFDTDVRQFLHDVAALGDPSYGHLTYRYSIQRTALELSLALIPDETVADSRTALRGYAWLTVLPPQLAERLGGVEQLRSSDAFHRVDPLPSGGTLLQATERYEDYGQDDAERIFPVLAPVLLPGEPRNRIEHFGPMHLAFRDAQVGS